MTIYFIKQKYMNIFILYERCLLSWIKKLIVQQMTFITPSTHMKRLSEWTSARFNIAAMPKNVQMTILTALKITANKLVFFLFIRLSPSLCLNLIDAYNRWIYLLLKIRNPTTTKTIINPAIRQISTNALISTVK